MTATAETIELNPLENPGNKQALTLWHQVMLEGVQKATFDLSARQMCLLLTTYMEPEKNTVRELADRLNISKPAICRGLDTLENLGLIKRTEDNEDRRNIRIKRTEKGFQFLRNFSESVMFHLMAI